MRKITILILLALFTLTLQAQEIPLGMRLETQKTWLKFVPKTYLKDVDGQKRVGTLLVTVKNYDVFETGSGQLYVNYTDARGTVRRKYLGYYYGKCEYNWKDYSFTPDSCANPMFDEQTSDERLANTIFFNRDTTKCFYFQLNKWSVPEKLDLLPWLAEDFKRVNQN